MGLYVPHGGGGFGSITNSYGTTRPSGAMGTSVTPGVGSLGSYVQLGSNLTKAAYGVALTLSNNFTAGASRETVVSLGVDEVGGSSFTARISGILCGSASDYGNAGGVDYYFPIYIPSGAAVGVAAQGTVATAFRVHAQFLHDPIAPWAIKVGALVETLGITGTSGTTVVPGTTSDGAWTEIGTLSRPAWWFQMGFQIADADDAWGGGSSQFFHADLAHGDGANFHVITEGLPILQSSNENLTWPRWLFGCERPLPSGARLFVRLQNSSTIDDGWQAAVYAVGG